MLEFIEQIEFDSKNYIEIFRTLESRFPTLNSSSRKELIRELATQIALEDEVLQFRLRKILREENPYLPAIKTEKVVNNFVLNFEDLARLKIAFLGLRRELLELLHNLPIEAWDRTGVHELEGHVPLREFVRRLVEKSNRCLHHIQVELESLSKSN